ncbi:DUF3810 domain-containing protein [Flavobacterium sp. NKUCC04_CG]|uniref:DUF3810 domain-containing protein n=1 Tax=Flavobacterium sp. NKUCC04_CG TaxID=2842121 RepID=UPI001C5B6222|nr:DUF3810 domain-containing protein [Flavobacterium sp. NKUCC04_CG]MBW3518723.1 DUF3810 domain-containing protein [Flavobacterium sp. NKUCC04_CG]
MRKNWFWILLLIIQYLLVKIFQKHPLWIENYYSNEWYIKISALFRKVYGFFPFSIGDILYFIVGLIIIINTVVIFKEKKGSYSWSMRFQHLFYFLIRVLAIFFLFFNLFWGYNNYRIPLYQKMELEREYTDDELIDFSYQLLTKVNQLQLEITGDSTKSVVVDYDITKIYDEANSGYQYVTEVYPWIKHENYALKSSLWSSVLSYMGFSGYINPFTNEAQVNNKVPKLGMYVTASHEIAHQIGYASESEANFIGYLNATLQVDKKYQYAGYIYALRYCLTTMERNEIKELETIQYHINPAVHHNLMENKVFWDSYRNISNSFFKVFYNNFLKINNQQEGIKSYNRFVDLLINYHKKKAL